MKIAGCILSCFLATTLCCLPAPALAAMGSSSPSYGIKEASPTGSENAISGSRAADGANPSPDSPNASKDCDEASEAEDGSGNGFRPSNESASNIVGGRPQIPLIAAETEDTNPPELVSTSLDKPVLNIGDTLTITYNISDSDGVRSVSLIMIYPNDRIVVRGTTGQFANERTSIKIMSTEEPGAYKVIGYKVVDGNGSISSIISSQFENKRTWNQDTFGQALFRNITVLDFQIKSSADPNPPQCSGDSIGRTVYHVGDTLTINCGIVDKDGISRLAAVVVTPSGTIVLHQGTTAKDGRSVSSTVTSNDTPGLYKVIGVQVSDLAGYVSTFVDSAYQSATSWPNTTYGKCTFASLPSVAFLIADGSKANAYHFTEGAEPTIKKGSDNALTFRIDGDLNDFVVATINGNDVPQKAYDLASGSTVITLKPSYLDSLRSGANEFAVWYANGGSAATIIDVLGSDDEPGEGPGVNDGNDGRDADPKDKNELMRAGLLQSGDKAALCVAISLFLMGALFAIVGTVFITRKNPNASK